MTTVPSRDRRWRKSSRTQDTNCVEITMDVAEDGTQDVRDSKNRSGPTLTFRREQLDAFLVAAKRGEIS